MRNWQLVRGSQQVLQFKASVKDILSTFLAVSTKRDNIFSYLYFRKHIEGSTVYFTLRGSIEVAFNNAFMGVHPA